MNIYLHLFFIGIILTVCFIVLHFLNKTNHTGYFIVDTSDPEKIIYRLELGENLEDIETRKSVKLKVVHGSSPNDSHKKHLL